MQQEYMERFFWDQHRKPNHKSNPRERSQKNLICYSFKGIKKKKIQLTE